MLTFRKSHDSLERDLVRQMRDIDPQKGSKEKRDPEPALKPKVVTNIDGARNQKKLDQRDKKREAEKAQNKKFSLREKFKIKLEHGKLIKNDPEAFSDQSSLTINQNTTLNKFNPLNPAYFPTTKMEQIPLNNEIRKIEQELQSLNQYIPQINKVE